MATRNAVTLGSTVHTYTGNGTDTTKGHDENFDTTHYKAVSGTNGSDDITLTSEHTFSLPHTIIQWKFRLKATANATGNPAGVEECEYTLRVDYKVSSGAWTTLSGSSYSDSDSGGTIALSKDTGATTINTTVADVTDVRAYVYTRARSSYDAYSATADIYEVQAYYTISKRYAGVV